MTISRLDIAESGNGMKRPEIERRAGPGAQPEAAGERLSIFTVTVDGEHFGIPIEYVRTIFRASAITRVPLAPAHLIGLINLRGHVVTAISLRSCLGMPAGHERPGLMVAVEYMGEGFALAIDAVGDVIEIHPDQCIPSPASAPAVRRMLTGAVYRTPDAIIPVLNIATLLGVEDKNAAEAAAA